MLRNCFIYITIFFLNTLLFLACKKDKVDEPSLNNDFVLDMSGTSILPSYSQRSGDPDSGYHYLVYGDYVNSGVPYNAFTAVFSSGSDNLLNRTGDNANIPYSYNAVDAANGVRVVSSNCLTCHSSKLNGDYILGLGNSLSDFTEDQSSNIPMVDGLMNQVYPPDSNGNPSAEWNAYEPFRNAAAATGPHIVTEKMGVNSADKLAAVLAAHRNNDDLSWSTTQLLPIPAEVIPSDVPAWWLLKKKNTMFYTAVGRGDFARIMMASSILTMEDSSEARAIDNKFSDVLAYLNTIEAPPFTGTIDQTLADEGKIVFDQYCSGCHGSYGTNETYPNIFVGLDRIGTDSLLSVSNYAYMDFVNYYNTSWFAQEPNSAFMEPGYGYVAPPLDGIWATAPYLHNASVPDLETLLNSITRPKYWKRSFVDSDYNLTKIGWNYTEESTGGDKYTYDTTIPGYGNSGHIFGDTLTVAQRTSLIEYLKTI